ncbi:MAG: glycoside hydrolase family 57 protein [Ferruginibacter sp.]
MPSICLYFKVHQPFQLKKYSGNDVTVEHCYEDAVADERLINILADECYLPSNEIMHKLINDQEGKFKISFAISGTVIELLMKYRPDVITSFQKLVATGMVSILAETYFHSLSYLYSPNEFKRQVYKHGQLIKKVFGIKPTVFRNTELIHDNQLAGMVAEMGYKGLLCEGHKSILNGRTANRVYAAPGNDSFGLLLRNTSLSDDIAFRFDDVHWNEYPLTAEKFANWLRADADDANVVNIFLDYETLGIYKKPASGIFEFLQALPGEIVNNTSYAFVSPEEVLTTTTPAGVYDCSQTVSWENKERERYVWCENMMQNNSIKKIYSLENKVLQHACVDAIAAWGRLQAADYFNYMSHERGAADEHIYHHEFDSPLHVFRNYTNILTDFELMLIRKGLAESRKEFPMQYADLRLF